MKVGLDGLPSKFLGQSLLGHKATKVTSLPSARDDKVSLELPDNNGRASIVVPGPKDGIGVFGNLNVRERFDVKRQGQLRVSGECGQNHSHNFIAEPMFNIGFCVEPPY